MKDLRTHPCLGIVCSLVIAASPALGSNTVIADSTGPTGNDALLSTGLPHAKPKNRLEFNAAVASKSTSRGNSGATKEGSRRLAFAVKFKDEISFYPVIGMFVLPGEQVLIEPLLEPVAAEFTFAAEKGHFDQAPRLLKNKPSLGWIWTAPKQPGLTKIDVTNTTSGQRMRINAFIMVPAKQAANGKIKRYPVGKYPKRPARLSKAYEPPRGFIEVTAANRKVKVSPNFSVGEFVTKLPTGYPKYVALRERLLLKLELLIDELQSAGYPASSLHIMSGYRTPHYNQKIGAKKFSRHQWGGAADIFVDESPRNGRMDDINDDGKVNIQDVKAIRDLIDELNNDDQYRPFVGGAGLYGPKPGVRGPFIHIDVRGVRARW